MEGQMDTEMAICPQLFCRGRGGGNNYQLGLVVDGHAGITIYHSFVSIQLLNINKVLLPSSFLDAFATCDTTGRPI